jgi:adenylate cyclase
MALLPNRRLVPVGGGAPIPLLRARITMGSSDACDVCLKLPGVSGNHCELVCDGKRWHIHGQASAGAVEVNGKRLAGREVLCSGDELTIGGRRFRYEEGQ